MATLGERDMVKSNKVANQDALNRLHARANTVYWENAWRLRPVAEFGGCDTANSLQHSYAPHIIATAGRWEELLQRCARVVVILETMA